MPGILLIYSAGIGAHILTVVCVSFSPVKRLPPMSKWGQFYCSTEMKALDSNDELTPLGHILARLPLEPRLGRMLVFACAFNLGGAMSLLAAQSSSGCDAFLTPPDRRRLSYDQLRYAAGTNSDHLATLNVFQV